MISIKKSKSHFLAAIGTVLIHLLLLGALSIDFSGEQSSKMSDAELDYLELQMENITPEDVSPTTQGRDPLTDQKDKSSESISKEKGALKVPQIAPERTLAEQEEQALAIPDTITPPKPVVVELVKKDSAKQAAKDSVMLAQINKFPKTATKFSTKNKYSKEYASYQYYLKNYRNIRNFKKVYPYAIKTRVIIDHLNAQLSTMTNEAAKKQLIKDTEKQLFKEYEAAVRIMTVSQGKLLLKLIARETNKTGYEIIKDYKGGFSASFWYGVGKIFGTDLKTEFHKEHEDSVIENILVKYNNDDLY